MFFPRLDPRETSVAVLTRRAVATMHGRRLKSKHAYSALSLLRSESLTDPPPDRVTIVDASVGYTVSTILADNVFELGFSPLGTYVITWQRPTKDANGDATKNLKVWRAVEAGDEHSVVGQFVQKSQTGWNLQYTPDEKLCARVVTNEVQFYQSDNLSSVWNKLRVEGVADFALSPGQTQSIAVFIPERKGQPAAVKVFIVPQFGAPVSQKSFFKGDKVQLKWNSSGTTLIVLAQTEVDKTGKSYYGETTLYLLSASGAFDSRIDLGMWIPLDAFNLYMGRQANRNALTLQTKKALFMT